jgi:DNA polymerase-3 subunit alpha
VERAGDVDAAPAAPVVGRRMAIELASPVQHKLRECLNQHRTDKDDAGIRVPVVAMVRHHDQIRYVRLGHQFCIKDSSAALLTLTAQAFRARLSSPLVAA